MTSQTRGNPAMLKAALICGLLGLLCLWPICASAEDKGMKLALSAMAFGQALDTVSTVQALNRGAVESNPLYGSKPSAAKLIAAKAPLIGVAWLLAKLSPHHPRIARGAAYTIGAVGFGLAVHNSRQARR